MGEEELEECDVDEFCDANLYKEQKLIFSKSIEHDLRRNNEENKNSNKSNKYGNPSEESD